MRKLRITLFLLLGLSSKLFSQEAVESRLRKSEIEQVFLAHNLSLMAQRFHIQQADAAVLQAKLWPNPTISISEVNLWKNSSSESFPALIGHYGKYQQLAVELEQTIEMAGKRKKRVQLQLLEKENARLQFEELLRNLKYDLRSQCLELQILQEKEQLYSSQVDIFQTLAKSFQNQWKEGNVSEMDYLRIESESIAFGNKLNEIQQEKIAKMNTVASYLGDKGTALYISDTIGMPLFLLGTKQEWKMMALENRSDYKIIHNTWKKSNAQLEIEKAERTPDLKVSMNYDRGGNIMRDFIGLGVAMDLPLFNRNQGNIKVAQLELEKNKVEIAQFRIDIEREIEFLSARLSNLESSLKTMDTGFDRKLDVALERYIRNFQERRLTIVEFIDFINNYMENKESILERRAKYLQYKEELTYLIGKDIV
ncbi:MULTISPECIES: TolC family protein [Sphingobacterium]|uniref:Cation efflux system protein CzcC n=1 Tax=Sphingobacterium multivorum TaxID=28454 RepID=A0A654D3V9_SPHMU|nr:MULTISPECIES: TolC family protein [Sphingobacterium]HBI90642.1 TolC family protein [Sphingobacterium sp.]QQT45075.1 TolC family protein [Sphingobacterium multivorum]QQT62270.1 TolC family protein [Sphingobacterium multivorum]SUJ20379.1 Cation efflux system protein CzcC [Sphingobacterium multivorum]VXD00469.1 Cation efflux system protein CzcC [Sphingobacterium multivorum]